jgi:hypothetical protein
MSASLVALPMDCLARACCSPVLQSGRLSCLLEQAVYLLFHLHQYEDSILTSNGRRMTACCTLQAVSLVLRGHGCGQLVHWTRMVYRPCVLKYNGNCQITYILSALHSSRDKAPQSLYLYTTYK